MIGLPFGSGAAQLTVAVVFPGVMTTSDGASGTAAGVTDADRADERPGPTALLAVTVNV